MGALKTVNNIDIHYQFADFSVETPGYWKLRAYNDFDNGDLVKVNGVPTREYYHKQILKFDFSKFGDAFTDSVRMTLTNLLNESFVTLFADNQAFVSAVTPGNYEAPLTYSLELSENLQNSDKSIFIIEDSQLDIGLLIAVERNMNRILQIIADYLVWNDEQIFESMHEKKDSPKERISDDFDVYEKDDRFAKIKKILGQIIYKVKDLFSKDEDEEDIYSQDSDLESEDDLTPKKQKQSKKIATQEEKAAKKAEKQAAKEQKKKKKQEEKLRKQQEKAAKKEEAQKVESSIEETCDVELPTEDASEKEPSVEEIVSVVEDESIDETSSEEITTEESFSKNEEEVSEDV